ncbi:FadR/GntR family transcriptional regulator [Celeribacter sp.]|uniref:FadR/GntR family transcriptional regulator n=1 Tax=Celeribacter sp. TaxID=1890673 RepID=UPI003A91BF95
MKPLRDINNCLFALPDEDRAQSRSEAVLNRLTDLISEGRLVAGDALPPESDLAAQFKVSKPTVREALRKLEMMGVIEIVHGRGSSVRQITAEPLQVFLRLAAGSLDEGISQVIEFRRAIEVSAAGLAALNGTLEQQDALRQIMADMDIAATDHDSWVAWDISFHNHIAAMTGNTLIRFMVEAMQPIMRQSISMIHGQKQHRDAEKTLARHVTLSNNILAGDIFAAQKAMEEHFDASASVAITYLSQEPGGDR